MNGHWRPAAVVVAVCVVGAGVAPSSWWGVGVAVAYAATVVLARDVMPSGGWWAGALFTVVLVTLLAGVYSFMVEPFGPQPMVALVFGVLLATAIAAASMT